MRKIILLCSILLLTTICYAEWKFNPHTGKLDYYEDVETTGGWTRTSPYIYPTTITDNVGIGTSTPLGLLMVGTSPTPPLLVQAGGNVGIGTTSPKGLLQVGTEPNVPLIVLINGNVGIGTTLPARKLDIIGTIRTTDTIPLMRLNILNAAAGTLPGAHLHITKTYILDRLRAWITGGTNVIFTVKGSVFPGTGPYYNLSVGQTAVNGGLTVTSFTGGSVPGDNLVIIDIVSVSGTIPGMGLTIDGHEQ